MCIDCRKCKHYVREIPKEDLITIYGNDYEECDEMHYICARPVISEIVTDDYFLTEEEIEYVRKYIPYGKVAAVLLEPEWECYDGTRIEDLCYEEAVSPPQTLFDREE